jgi:YVTN family beta-propeller protein
VLGVNWRLTWLCRLRGSLLLINEATNTVTATIGAGSGPDAVGVDPSTHTVYVANFGSNNILVINGATNTVTATIGVGSRPDGVG